MEMKKSIGIFGLLVSLVSYGDPPDSYLFDARGNAIGSTVEGGQRGINAYILNSTPVSVPTPLPVIFPTPLPTQPVTFPTPVDVNVINSISVAVPTPLPVTMDTPLPVSFVTPLPTQPVTVTNFPATQPVSFASPLPVSQDTSPWVVDGSGVTQPVSFPTPLPTQPVVGPLTDAQPRDSAVPVSFPTPFPTQPVLIPTPLPVSFPTPLPTQPVVGPLTDAQLRASAVPVSFPTPFPTQPITGSASASNFPATQPVSFASPIPVTFPTPLPTQPVVFTTPIPISKIQDTSGSGTITALDGVVTATTTGASSVAFNVSGTWSATLEIEATTGDGIWAPIAGYVPLTASVIAPFFAINTSLVVPVNGFSQVRLRAALFTSGTVAVQWNSSLGTGIQQVFNPAAASFLVSSWTKDGAGNSITSTSSALDVNVKSTPLPVSFPSPLPTQPVIGPLTDTQLRASAVPVSFPTPFPTQPVVGPLTDTQLRASAVPVSFPTPLPTQPVTMSVQTAGGTTPFRNTAVTNTAVAVKASAGNLYYYHAYNTNTADCFLQFYDVASGSVTVGTTTPTLTMAIASGAVLDGSLGSGPFSFGTAITIATTTTATGGAACTTALLVDLGYK